MKRVKCIATRAYRGAHRDPELVLGRFYTVEDEQVHTIADETPYIRVSFNRSTIERPRHLFGPILTDG